jgi:hypothetical protein
MKLVILSSAETEYVALCEATTEIIFLRQLLSDIGFEQAKPTIIYEDNMACIAMSNGNANHKHSKHIDVRYHFTREQIIMKRLLVIYCKTEEMIADVLTKGLDKKLHYSCISVMMNLDKTVCKYV